MPAIIACYTRNGLRWHVAAKHVPRRWYLKDQVNDDSPAYDRLFSGKECRTLGKQSVDTWFINDNAVHHEVMEQCVPIRGEEVLVLISDGRKDDARGLRARRRKPQVQRARLIRGAKKCMLSGHGPDVPFRLAHCHMPMAH